MSVRESDERTREGAMRRMMPVNGRGARRAIGETRGLERSRPPSKRLRESRQALLGFLAQVSIRRRIRMSESSASAESLARTPLHALLELGGEAFAGYEMPVQYPAGIMKEHNHTRTAAGLFDVSHMGGPARRNDAAAALESLVPVDVIDLGIDHQRYALFTNDAGGILDDLMITNAGDHLFVVNAACKQQDTARMRQYLGNRCRVEELTDRALLARKGQRPPPMSRLAPETAKMLFMTAARVEIEGAECFVARSGYTGEDGYEISVPAERADAGSRPPGAGRSEADWARRARPRVSRRACASTGTTSIRPPAQSRQALPGRCPRYAAPVAPGRAATLAPMSSPGSSRRGVAQGRHPARRQDAGAGVPS